MDKLEEVKDGRGVIRLSLLLNKSTIRGPGSISYLRLSLPINLRYLDWNPLLPVYSLNVFRCDTGIPAALPVVLSATANVTVSHKQRWQKS
jgi:hypothetical protein